MENIPDHSQESSNDRVSKRMLNVLKDALYQIRGIDINPHEGRIRDSIMPSQYMDVPDFPPED